MGKLSPMMQQYIETKKQYPDSILFYRLGDFYEMFFEDAKLVSRLLELTLTGRNCGLEERAPMCGVPFHAADSYIARLVEMGYSVAICEQLEDPKTTKGMVKRGVTQVVTPGTITSGAMLHENENNYLASAYLDEKGMSISYCDISTGELKTTEKLEGTNLYEDMVNELVKIHPKEILINASLALSQGEEEIAQFTGAFVRRMPDTYYSQNAAKEAIRAQFGQLSLTALSLDGRDHCLLSIGVLLSYLLETQKQSLQQLTSCQYYEMGLSMALDRATLRNLEITETLFEKKTKGSLLGVLDHTRTAMGGRLLKTWLRQPLNHVTEIQERLDAVEELTIDPLRLNHLKEALTEIYDFERLGSRIASGTANGKDMIALRNSMAVLPDILNDLYDTESVLLQSLYGEMQDFHEIKERIGSTIAEDPPLTIREGNLIQKGANQDLDALHDSIADAKTWISTLDAEEKKRTGITHLKVGFNKVFGYYIEVSRSNLDLVPEDYIRKQTLVGAERFITPKLKEMESIVLNAETKINQLEYEIFTELRTWISSWISEIQRTSHAISVLDVLCSFAQVSLKNNYTKPVVNNDSLIEIKKGRHPVIEQMTEQGLFVSNDTYLNREDASMLIITGPNMAGKSTYMRQTALIVLMAQVGCYVPAESAVIGVCDRIFTRIGASDNLAQGQSTFFVEMSELAYILRNATDRSLIILDEIGRGTSTYDGLSIAWATVEHLCQQNHQIRTLFATHYHEMTILEGKLPGVQNLNVDVSEDRGEIVFLHRIIPGSASRSYGVHVAKLAGVPNSLLENAEWKLETLEQDSRSSSVRDAFLSEKPKESPEPQQISMVFEAPESPVLEKLRNVNIMDITPSQAIKLLEELQSLL